MNQFLSNKIIAGIVALALLVGVGVLISSGDTSSTTRNAALVVATPCTKPGQVTKVSKQSVVCATTNTGSLWYATMKAKGKAQACTTPGAIRKKSNIVWVCGVVKKKKLWQATQPLPPAVVASTTGIEPSATQPTPALDSTQVATPDVPVVADNTVLADPKIPDDKIVTKAIEDVTPTTTTSKGPVYTSRSTTTTIPKTTTTTTTTTIPKTTTSTTTTTTTPIRRPTAPRGVSGEAGDTSIAVSWLAPSSDGGSAVTGYTVTASRGGSHTCITATLACVVNGLTSGTAYTFTVKATNALGDSPASEASAPVTSLSCAAGGVCVVGSDGPGGGKVFYDAGTRQSWGRYLEAAPTDYKVGTAARTRVQWGCRGTLTEATAEAIGTGKANTDKIRAACPTADIAADVANKYFTSTAGAGQWFLPSKDELNQMYDNMVAIGGFAASIYWSSSETSSSAGAGPSQDFGSYGKQGYHAKDSTNYVRPVRAFGASSPSTTPTPAIPLTCATGGTCKMGERGPGGGIVFYDAGTTQSWGRYLEAAPNDYKVGTDEHTGAEWGCRGTLTGATAEAIGTGKANTATIRAACPTADIAADVANKYFTSTAGAGQWFLPSRGELNELCKYARTQTTGTSTVGCDGSGALRNGFAGDLYWSSSEDYEYRAWYQVFSNGYQYFNGKPNTYYLRPIRAF